MSESEEKEKIEDSELQKEFDFETLIFKGRVWKEYKIRTIKFALQSLLTSEIEIVNNIPANTNLSTYSTRYLAMSIKHFNGESWEKYPFEHTPKYDKDGNLVSPEGPSKMGRIKEIPSPITDKMLEILESFRLEVRDLLSDIKKK